MTMQIKPCETSDIEIVATMMRDFYLIDAYPFDETKAKQRIGQFLNQPDWGRICLIENEGAVAGYYVLTYIYSFEFGGRMAFIDELYINPEFRGRGAGKFAMDQILEFATASGLKMLYLEIEPENHNAAKLYQSRGFEMSKRGLMRRPLN